MSDNFEYRDTITVRRPLTGRRRNPIDAVESSGLLRPDHYG
jgi:hypothetical protein